MWFLLFFRLWQYLITRSGLSTDTIWQKLSKSDISKLALSITACTYMVEGRGFIEMSLLQRVELNLQRYIIYYCLRIYFIDDLDYFALNRWISRRWNLKLFLDSICKSVLRLFSTKISKTYWISTSSLLCSAGEVLDIDGITGGYNFQSAWTSGWVAGSACGSAL